MQLHELLSRLDGVRQAGSGFTAKCPSHNDQRNSLSVSPGAGGGIVLHCHAGCESVAVVQALGITMQDLAPQATSKPRIVAEYPYCDEHAAVLYKVLRYEPKDFRQRRADGSWKLGDVRRVPYRLPELVKADPTATVFVTEGEKDADRLAALGLIATTNAGGAGKWRPEYNEPLRGRHVVILPDNDEPGQKHAEKVQQALTGIAASVRILELPSLPVKGDVSDWLNAGGTREELERLAGDIDIVGTRGRGDTGTDSYVPFPTDALPGPCREFVESGAMAMGCDPSYLALPLLAALAAAIGLSRKLRLKDGWDVLAILWLCLVGESGTLKTPAQRKATKPIWDLQTQALTEHAEAMSAWRREVNVWESEYAAWQKRKGKKGSPPDKPAEPVCKRYVVSDATIESLAPILLANPRGLLLLRDELNGWFGSFDKYSNGKGDSASWLSMYNGEPLLVDRKTGTPRTLYVPNAALWIAGGIQPGILRRVLGQEHRESGLAARILLANPPRLAKHWTEDQISAEQEGVIDIIVRQLYTLLPTTDLLGGQHPEVVELTPEAKAVWIAYYNEHAAEQVDLVGDLAAAWSKLEEAAARLALVIHLTRWAAGDSVQENRLDEFSMTNGIRLAKWFAGEARRVYGILNESEAEEEHRQLLELVSRRGGSITVRDLTKAVRRFRNDQEAAESSLKALADAGYGELVTGRNQSRRFDLAPRHHVTTSPQTIAL